MALESFRRAVHPQRLKRTWGAARCVRQPIAFTYREYRSKKDLRSYKLRSNGLQATIRHPLLDMWVLEEIFRFDAYAIPAEAAQALRGLDRPVRVADLGGNVGLFGLHVLGEFPNAHLHSFEPEPSNIATLRRTIADNAFGEQWELTEACAAVAEGTLEFEGGGPLGRVATAGDGRLGTFHESISGWFPFLEGSTMLSEERRSVPAVDAFPVLLDADLVKMDIEGGEWVLLADPRFADIKAKVVVLEVHRDYAPMDDPDRHVVDLLTGMGFTTAGVKGTGEAGTLWAWR